MALSNVHLTPQLVQAVRDAIEIVDIASEHTRLQKAGRRYKGLCPLHKEKTPSFSVDPDQGLYYCFGCGRGGDAIKLHMELSGDDFPAAIESLAGRYSIPLPKSEGRRRSGSPDRGIETALAAAEEFFRERLASSPEVRAYLEKRRIPPELVETHRLGYAPDGWRNLVPALKAKVGIQPLVAAGLAGISDKRPDEPYDRFRHRLMFPVRNAAGRLVGFGGRTLGDDPAKYVNTAETAAFHKGRLLYGLDVAKREIRDGGTVVLVEGYFDVLGAAAAGVRTAVASMGTALTADQARLAARYAQEVVIAYDGDEAGVRAARRALPVLLSAGLPVRRADLGAGHDPDSLRLEKGDEALLAALEDAPDLVRLELGRRAPVEARGEPRRQAEAARAVTELLAPIGDSVLRHGYAREAADRIGVPVDLLWSRVRKAPAPAAEEPEETPRSADSEVRTLEERVLQLLLTGGVELPVESLPDEAAFLDPASRSLYRAYCELFAAAGEPPTARQVFAGLPDGMPGLDRLTGLFFQEEETGSGDELSLALVRLEKRRRRQQLRTKSAEIREAQAAGDEDRVEKLLAERSALSRELHGG